MTALCLVIGDPIDHSLSPLIHNAGYRAAGIADEFYFAAARVAASDLAAAAAGIRALRIRGVSCTLPHKVAVMALLDEIKPEALRMGAVNTIVNESGRLIGYNTDMQGVAGPLGQRTALRGKRAAVLGAGGAARAAVFGLRRAGAEVTVFNRSVERGESLARQQGAVFLPWEKLAAVSGFDIIINCTPLGMQPDAERSPVPPEYLRPGQIVMDAVYTPDQTRLLREAAARGAEVISGTEMFVAQGAAQFELYTGRAAPVEAMERALKEHLGVKP